MKQLFTLLILCTLQIMLSCNNVDSTKLSKKQPNETASANNAQSHSDTVFYYNADEILKDFMTWYTYTYYNVRLAQDFIGVDADSSRIDKTAFLNHLATGNYVPFKIRLQDNLPVYQLYKLNKPDQDIQNTIKQSALNEMSHYRWEGKELPGYGFTDLNGKVYNRSTTKGKILVLKCWFIRCVACVKEFPELNKLVDEYKDRNDILFISLATDSRQDLLSFVHKNEFKYAVVPDKEEYMSEQLSVTSYPTHLLIDKNGKIVKVVNAVNDLIPFLKKEVEKTSL